MKRILAPIAAVAVASQAAASDWRADAVADVRSEQKVVEAQFAGPSSFWASVRDDGSRRDGFASYLCTSLRLSGMPVGETYVIRIWDAAAMARGEQREIGRDVCTKS